MPDPKKMKKTRTPMPEPKKMMKTRTPMPQAGRDKPLPETNFDASFSRYNPGY
jgi:hypothetical protein